MKKFILFFLLIAIIPSISAQDILGSWKGNLELQGMELPLIFHISKSENGYTSTMDSPNQGAFGIATDTTTFENNILTISVKSIQFEYSGKLKGDDINGKLTQFGQQYSINLKRDNEEKPAQLNRPQEPKPPFSYKTEDIQFYNSQDHIHLAGTLTLPKQGAPFPAVILITGSGPQNRDEEIMGHKPFLVLADDLTKKGIAVLRYDDRGIGDSEGNFSQATTVDFATDVKAALQYLKSRKDIDHSKIGLIGHSEGSNVGVMVAAHSNSVDFLVMLAGPGFAGNEVLKQQNAVLLKASGMSDEYIQNISKINSQLYDIVMQNTDVEKMRQQLSQIPITQQNSHLIEELTSPWMRYFLQYDPKTDLGKINIPILALNGEKDTQVIPELNLNAIQATVEKSGNHQISTKELKGLNHLFQEAETGAVSEYAIIEQTFSPLALKEISDWILKTVQ